MAKEEDVGLIGGVNVGLPILMTMGAFLAIALYNVIELTFLIFATFKQRNGIYFWSIIVATWGITPHTIGFIFKFFQVITVNVISSSIVGFGWVCMVTGQSLVLYSRLHLVVQGKRRIRWVLYMILFDAIVVHCPVIVLALVSESMQAAPFIRGFMLYDKIQIVVFSVQETIISAIYIYETVRLLEQSNRHGDRRNQGPLRKLLAHLIFVNVVVVILDITLLAVQFSGLYMIQTTYKTAVYSVKLKIEFSILNRLVQIVTGRRSPSGNFHLNMSANTSGTSNMPIVCELTRARGYAVRPKGSSMWDVADIVGW
ncbi:hypothetical protein BKA66DRAFT_448279 [Pyrenochaeta sp. MPI-SDFR-AT-0127]|nr:hypothetical protein BKA66DRAFT_448279 [Pyrenochaeta sp. MPI-SDFR-AT-0127]